MTSKTIKRAVLALVALTAVACRDGGDTDTGPQDAGNDVRVGNDVVPTDSAGQDVVVDSPADAPASTTVTIRQLQDITDPMHPATGAHVTLGDPTLVALTPREILGSSRGDSTGRCRFGIWVGTGATGPFTGVHVQELVNLGDAGDCFGVTGRIPDTLVAGAAITALGNVSYSEFCGGPTGIDRTMCRNFEQTELFLTGASTLTIGATGAAPVPTDATAPQLAGAMGGPGTMTLDLEGDLVVVRNARLVTTTTVNDAGTFTDGYLVDPADTAMTNRVKIIVSNFRGTTCVRNFIASHDGMTITSITGTLLPDFGAWSIRLRDQSDVGGLDCTTDGGAGDAGMDSGTTLDAATGG